MAITFRTISESVSSVALDRATNDAIDPEGNSLSSATLPTDQSERDQAALLASNGGVVSPQSEQSAPVYGHPTSALSWNAAFATDASAYVLNPRGIAGKPLLIASLTSEQAKRPIWSTMGTVGVRDPLHPGKFQGKVVVQRAWVDGKESFWVVGADKRSYDITAAVARNNGDWKRAAANLDYRRRLTLFDPAGLPNVRDEMIARAVTHYVVPRVNEFSANVQGAVGRRNPAPLLDFPRGDPNAGLPHATRLGQAVRDFSARRISADELRAVIQEVKAEYDKGGWGDIARAGYETYLRQAGSALERAANDGADLMHRLFAAMRNVDDAIRARGAIAPARDELNAVFASARSADPTRWDSASQQAWARFRPMAQARLDSTRLAAAKEAANRAIATYSRGEHQSIEVLPSLKGRLADRKLAQFLDAAVKPFGFRSWTAVLSLRGQVTLTQRQPELAAERASPLERDKAYANRVLASLTRTWSRPLRNIEEFVYFRGASAARVGDGLDSELVRATSGRVRSWKQLLSESGKLIVNAGGTPTLVLNHLDFDVDGSGLSGLIARQQVDSRLGEPIRQAIARYESGQSDVVEAAHAIAQIVLRYEVRGVSGAQQFDKRYERLQALTNVLRQSGHQPQQEIASVIEHDVLRPYQLQSKTELRPLVASGVASRPELRFSLTDSLRVPQFEVFGLPFGKAINDGTASLVQDVQQAKDDFTARVSRLFNWDTSWRGARLNMSATQGNQISRQTQVDRELSSVMGQGALFLIPGGIVARGASVSTAKASYAILGGSASVTSWALFAPKEGKSRGELVSDALVYGVTGAVVNYTVASKALQFGINRSVALGPGARGFTAGVPHQPWVNGSWRYTPLTLDKWMEVIGVRTVTGPLTNLTNQQVVSIKNDGRLLPPNEINWTQTAATLASVPPRATGFARSIQIPATEGPYWPNLLKKISYYLPGYAASIGISIGIKNLTTKPPAAPIAVPPATDSSSDANSLNARIRVLQQYDAALHGTTVRPFRPGTSEYRMALLDARYKLIAAIAEEHAWRLKNPKAPVDKLPYAIKTRYEEAALAIQAYFGVARESLVGLMQDPVVHAAVTQLHRDTHGKHSLNGLLVAPAR